MGAVESADAAVGRGDPEKALAVLVEVFNVHPEPAHQRPCTDALAHAQKICRSYSSFRRLLESRSYIPYTSIATPPALSTLPKCYSSTRANALSTTWSDRYMPN